MKNKKETQTIINDAWNEQLISRDNPTQDEVCKQVLEDLYMDHDDASEKTNNQMYKEIMLLHESQELDYEIINKVFNLESRTELDLKNLREFIVVVTIMCGQDVLKAQVRNDTEKQKVEIKKHEKRCNLMTILIEAIDSVIVTCDK